MTPEASLPNAILGGAPKCGTSALFSWLTAHPRVCGSTPKETYFLLDRGHPLGTAQATFYELGWDGYRRFFPGCTSSGADVMVEATTHYLFQTETPRLVSTMPGPPSVVFLLRQPADRVYSSFEFTRNNLARIRGGLTFADYVDIAINRPGDLAEYVTDPASLYVLQRDIEYGHYVRYLRRWRAAVAPERIQVGLYEALRKNPRALLEETARFLGLDPQPFEDLRLERVNPTRKIRSKTLHRRVLRAARLLPSGRLKTGARELYNKVASSRRTMEPSREDRQALRALDDLYAESSRELAAEFQLDVSPWSATR